MTLLSPARSLALLSALAFAAGCGGASSSSSGGGGTGGGTCTAATTCSNHGACTTAGTCSCDTGWSGAACDACAVGYSGPTCTTTPTGTAPAASVTSGVAPLAVFFDATGIAGMADDDFLNADIAWQFGDTGAGAYATTGKPRNAATGFVTAHVYEEPGTYPVTATIVDRTGKTWTTPAVTITVTAFSGETRCLSASGDFSSAPAGCAQVTSADLVAQLAWLSGAAQRRLLLHRGEVWSLPDGATIGGPGPKLLGAYGTGTARPRLEGAGDRLDLAGRDVRVTEVETSKLTLSMSGSGILALRVYAHGAIGNGDDVIGVGVGMGGDHLFLADSDVLQNRYFSVYADGSQMAITGSNIDQVRVATSWGRADPLTSRDVFVGHNRIDAGGRTDGTPTTSLKWHSRRGVITDNLLVVGDWMLTLNTDTGERPVKTDAQLGTVLIERNVLRPASQDPVNAALNDSRCSLGVQLTDNSNVVIRNNLLYDLDMVFGDGGAPPSAYPPSSNVSILNNTFYRRQGHLNYDMGELAWLWGNTEHLRIANNVVYSSDPESTDRPFNYLSAAPATLVGLGVQLDHNVYYRVAGAGTGDGFAYYDGGFHGFSDWQAQGWDASSVLGDPRFVSADPTRTDFLELGPGSAAVGAGAAVPVYFDAKRRWRGASIDAGALQHVP